MVKWTSKRGCELAEKIKESLLSGEWGNIFDDAFDPAEFQYHAMRESDDEWEASFSQKQFQANLKSLITNLIKEHKSADTEEQDLHSGSRRRGGRNGGADEALEADKDFDGEEEGKGGDPKIVSYPSAVCYHGDPRSSDEFCSVLTQIPHGSYYVQIDGRVVKVSVAADPTLFDPEVLIATNRNYDSMEWGEMIASFSRQGRRYFNDEFDHQDTTRIRLVDEFLIKYDIEQNFVAKGGIPAWYDFMSANGNRFLFLTVARVKKNKNRYNAVLSPQQHILYNTPSFQPQMNPYSNMPSQQPTAGNFSLPFGPSPHQLHQSPAMLHHNSVGYNGNPTHSGGGHLIIHQIHQTHHTPTSLMYNPHMVHPGHSFHSPWNTIGQPDQFPAAQQGYADVAALPNGNNPSNFIGQTLATPQQLKPPPVPPPTHHVSFSLPHQMVAGIPSTHQPNHLPAAASAQRTPANLKRDMSISSDEYTEQTVEEAPPAHCHDQPVVTYVMTPKVSLPTSDNENNHYRGNSQQQVTPESVATAATRNTLRKAETPKHVPAKKSFFQQVGEIMTVGSTSSGSAHMHPSPKKYYGRAGEGYNTSSTVVETVSSGDESSTSL